MMPVIAALGEFERQMRLGSLEIVALLAAVALVAARPRIRAAADVGALTPMVIDLDILERGDRRTFQGRPPFELGRTREAEIFLRDAEVSRRHARFESHGGFVYVEDLQSSNGTFLNGRRVTEAIEVRAGDEIDVGATRIVVASVQSA